MKCRLFLLSLLLGSSAVAATTYNPFLDDRIYQSKICQSSLKTLVENDVFNEVKNLVDMECNNIVRRGWVKGLINKPSRMRCQASYQYLAERPELQKVAKTFLMNGCYPENPDKFYWKPHLTELNTVGDLQPVNTVLKSEIISEKSTGDLLHEDSIIKKPWSAKAIIPIYSQKVAFSLPITWKAAFQDNKPSTYMMEFTPKDERLESWNNLITVQGLKNLAKKISPKKFMDKLSYGFKKICGDQLVYEKLGYSFIDGHRTFTAILGCARMPNGHQTAVNKGQSEIGFYFSIQGKKDLYIVHKSIRGDAFPVEKPPLNKSNAQEFIKEILPIEICNKDANIIACMK